MKSKLPLLIGLSAVLLATSCSAASPTSEESGTSAEPVSATSQSQKGDKSSATPSASPSASASKSPASVSAKDIIPTLAKPQTDEDRPSQKFNDSSIKKSSFRALAPLSYAQEFAATNKEGDLCLVAWAQSGDGDGSATINGPETECDAPAEVQKDGLTLNIDGSDKKPGVVLAMLPPDVAEKDVRTVLLKIPGNHEDLRPPVEFKATDFGIVSVAMEPATAKELGTITIPRKDGSDFTLDLD
ncbi:hypothetical protein [Glutamicibacter sp. M10]|uniref:hypothetical protein n=1 Tax=Glutamicibacter sp. M10 TaxID=3023076 RepID=UPI0021C63473|nr:hypothetical protein [Glutamicibacter sp. M10]UXN31360.1 hypothetical protein N6V40_13415 [Glutamicibacter sp. M10]